jgi:hypothetical protein
MNCNNLSVCGPNLGGGWGWAVVNANGTGDLQATFCFHVLGMGGGAGHSSVDSFAWHIAGGVFVIGPASDPSFEGPSPIPAQPRHQSQKRARRRGRYRRPRWAGSAPARPPAATGSRCSAAAAALA